MNNKDLLKAIGEIDDKYLIEENYKKESNSTKNMVSVMKNLKMKYALVPICAILVAVIIIYRGDIFNLKSNDVPQNSKINSSKGWIIKEVPDDRNINEAIVLVPKWEEMSISQQFLQCEYSDNKYTSRITKISTENIENEIGTATLTGHDTYTKTDYIKNGNVYSIKDLSEECAIAVKFEDDINYYVYVNSNYRPATLGEFMEKLNLKEITSFGTIYYNYWDKDSQGNMEYKRIEFYDVDNKKIWDMLFNNLDLENIYSDTNAGSYMSEKYTTEFSISVNIQLLGYKNISVSLTDKGYLITNILDTGKGFYIGEDKVQDFLNYIKENYDGYQIIYNDNNIDISEEDEKNGISVIENTVISE